MSDSAKKSKIAIGVDIGGTGIKAAIVDYKTGELVSDRLKLPTPEGGKPQDIADTVIELLGMLPEFSDDTPIGVCFPAVAQHGVTMSAANVSHDWIGLHAEEFFSKAIGRPIWFVNDADAAGYAEAKYGVAKDQKGLVILTTLGTGIGSALIYNGVLIPNSELGHIDVGQVVDYEKYAANSAREREELSYPEWALRLQDYYDMLEKVLWPDLFVVGGGVSKSDEKFLPLLKLRTPIVPAALRNNAGIMGAAALAAKH